MGSSGLCFFGNVSNCSLNSYGKFGGAMRRRFFFAICEKPEGRGRKTAPGLARVKAAVHWLRVGAIIAEFKMGGYMLSADSACPQHVAAQRVLIAAHFTFSDDYANSKPVDGSLKTPCLAMSERARKKCFFFVRLQRQGSAVSETTKLETHVRVAVRHVIFIEFKISKKNTDIILRNAILKNIYYYHFVEKYILAG